jgi:hypothetical protein
MKKFFVILLLVSATAFSITSCTEEEVAPSTELENGGGQGSIDPIKI